MAARRARKPGPQVDVKRGTSPGSGTAGPRSEAGYRALADEARRGSRPGSGEDARLLAAASQGDQQARESLVNAHLDWVVGEAEARAGRGLSEGDLFQEGSLGLMKAVREFQESGRADFETFAREEVARHMDSALSQEDRAQEDSRKLVEAAEDYERAELSLRQELGREATPSELAAKLEWSADRTAGIGELVADARRRHDEELLTYLDPEEIDLGALLPPDETAQHAAAREGGGSAEPSQMGPGEAERPGREGSEGSGERRAPRGG
jgi:RNA polymerase sigma factor (sigma-70 family)